MRGSLDLIAADLRVRQQPACSSTLRNSFLHEIMNLHAMQLSQWLSHIAPMLRLAERRRESLPILAQFPDPDSH